MTITYKLFKRRKDGSIGPLFICQRLRIPLNEWLQAEDHPTKGYARRPGWHSGLSPIAPHLSEKNRVWAECEVEDGRWYPFPRPSHQGATWIISESLKVLRLLSSEEVEAIRLSHQQGA